MSYGENQDEVFLGMSVSRTQNASEATVQKIDTEIRRFVEEGYNEATRILTEKRADLEALAKGLLEFETLTGDEITDLLEGQEAEPRVGAGADHAAHFGGAAGRQAAPASRSGCRPGAAAAGVSGDSRYSQMRKRGGNAAFFCAARCVAPAVIRVGVRLGVVACFVTGARTTAP